MHNTYYNHVTCNVQYPINNILQFTAYIANVYYAVYIYILYVIDNIINFVTGYYILFILYNVHDQIYKTNNIYHYTIYIICTIYN